MDPRVAGALQQAHDLVAEMIKQAANEPSLGLYFVQQHVHNAVPAIVSLKEQVVDGAHEAELSTDDARDATAAVKVMKEVGPPAIKKMIQHLSSATQALHPSRRAVEQQPNYAKTIWDNALDKASNITRRSSAVDINKAGESSPVADAPGTNSSSPYGYVRSVLESASQRVGSLGSWSDSPATPKPDEDPSSDSARESGKSSSILEAVQVKPGRYVRAVIDTALMRKKETPAAAAATPGEDDSTENVIVKLHSAESFDKFQAENAAKLAQWLDQP